jgi:GxxExxY protein
MLKNESVFRSKNIDYIDKSMSNSHISIHSLKDLEVALPILCRSVFHVLGSKNLEATYQRALIIDLEEAGVTILSEVSITITYKGRSIGTRRADIICKLSNGEVAVLELKAVANLTSENCHQLQFYMHHFKIDHGYLINFPHDTGFPDLPEGDKKDVFVENIICGMESIKLSDRTMRNRHANDDPQIIHYQNIKSEKQVTTTRKADPASLIQRSSTNGQEKGPIPRVVLPSRTTWGKTLKGVDCKICLKQGTWCSKHLSQRPE